MRHTPRALSRAALATATVLAATTGLTGVAVAEDPDPLPSTEGVVIPDPGRFVPRVARVESAGPTGFLRYEEGTKGGIWTDLATGADRNLGTASTGAVRHSGRGATFFPGSATEQRRVEIQDIAAGTRKAVPVPADQIWTGAFDADTVLTYAENADGTIAGLHLRSEAADGQVTDRPVTGLGETGKVWVVAQDLRGVLLTTQAATGGPFASYLLDYATAALTPTLPIHRYSPAVLGADRILVAPDYHSVLTVPRDNPTATPVTTPLPTRQPNETGFGEHAVIGDWIVTRREVTTGEAVGTRLWAVPIGGGPAKELLPASVDRLTVAPDGSVIVVGGSGAQDWAAHRITLGEDGTPRLTKVRDIAPVPVTYDRLDIAGGRVDFRSDSGPKEAVYEVDVDAPTEVRRLAEPDGVDGLRALGDGRSAYLHGSSAISPTGDGTARQVNFPPATRLADAAGRFVIAEHEDKQYVGDLGERPGTEAKVLLTLPRTAAAVWGTTLWKPTATPGKLSRYDLVGNWNSVDLDLRTGCTPTELQVVQSWIYWACGPEGKAGVFNQWGATNVSVPVGEAVLGDGYLVRRDNAAGKLLLTDARTGRTSELADVPVITSGSGRWKDWAVDKYGGGVAYVDERSRIHVVPTGIAPQPVSAIHATVDPYLNAESTSAQSRTWDARWRLSRPVAQWKVEIRNRYSGKLVRTLTGAGGPAATVTTQWTGQDDEGRGVTPSSYTYRLLVAPWKGDAFVDVAGANGTFDARNTLLTTLPGRYLPLRPQRILDSRTGLGTPKGKVQRWQNVVLQVGGVGGVPATGVTSVVLNVTVANPTKPGDIKVTPSLDDYSAGSHLNFTAGQTTSNLVVVPVVDGKVRIFVNTAGTADLVADVSGYYTDGSGGSAFRPLTPTRFMDTRSGTGVPRAKIGPGGTARLQVTGARGVPADGVTAVVMNVTATNATASTFVTAYPDGTARPDTSSVNVPAGRTVAGTVVVPVVGGKIAFANRFGSLDLVGDVVGYYTSGEGVAFTGMTNRRFMDTRTGQGVRKGAVGPGQSVTLPVAGVGVVPAGAKAVVLNVTATQPTRAGFISVHPSGQPRTSASSLNFQAGQTVPNMVVVPVVDGKVTFYNHSGSVQLIADVQGWFA
ncbi:hypothetical protein [Streptomyces sp. NBC_01268]|uniref:hypothetical protein n=1 Tax=Streptomyces sp. NBC_01268 TaxID=2903806 RepID=UPI002E374E6F|nr:hypothetical protein [Streptomyces sp. NBC_01268]